MDFFGLHLPSLAVAVATVPSTFTVVLAAFSRFDKDQSEANRKFSRDFLLGLKVDERKWTSFFADLFERFFGKQHLSIKCALRSFALSVVLILTIFTLWVVKTENLFAALTAPADIICWAPVIVFALLFVFVFLACGCIADYLSLWKTRFLLTKSNLLHCWRTAVIVVVGDAVATGLYIYRASCYCTRYFRVNSNRRNSYSINIWI